MATVRASSEVDMNSRLEKLVVDGWKRFSPEIDITGFMRSANMNPEEVGSCIQNIKYGHPEIFYFKGAFTVRQWNRASGELVKATLQGLEYDFGASEYDVRKRRFNTVVLEAMHSAYHETDEVGKALRLHDYLVRICDYDLAASEAKDHSHRGHTAYDALVLRKAVCEGYAMAYRHLLNVAGIVSSVAVSAEDFHIWNYVRIYGKWYHVDVTFDDPICLNGISQRDRISHTHFLMSDKKALATGHHAWNVHGLPPASDERYDIMV